MKEADMKQKLTIAAAILAFGAGTAGSVGIAQAKHGADDPPGHVVRDDHGGRHVHAARERHHHHHHHRARHNDDGPNHT
jgi:hypothetical protein